ncbi:hypothetical protein GUITHDRAFT_139456 [Guillardia theta CCMP2712]|uniref:Uncharacterized protein n=1 Tax=Guillardia theta (strain CCMP2712) TaxID=905079 RepID=L1J957_GUITC|nr:hypothetical protein GUITHDRAFT_139456 [Guillardia theta CCMP2712]EKX44832.1 hypothetical protein GUITHDRAFT_139456 [Guillardia theta CCMP2712]|eukprot:XP_005831812.1 hypothetical protein GUITHDRAFT_139456 [Guillardia theta CCMP2712]
MASKNPNAQDLLPVFGVATDDPPAMAPHTSKVKRAGGWKEERADRSEVSDRYRGAQVVRARAVAQGETLDAHFQRSKLQRDKGHLLGKEDPYKSVPSKRKHDLREEEARPRTRDRAGEALGKKRASSSRLSAHESDAKQKHAPTSKLSTLWFKNIPLEESASGRKGQVESKEGADKSNVEKQDHAHSFTMHASDIKVKLFDFSSIENKLVKSAKAVAEFQPTSSVAVRVQEEAASFAPLPLSPAGVHQDMDLDDTESEKESKGKEDDLEPTPSLLAACGVKEGGETCEGAEAASSCNPSRMWSDHLSSLFPELGEV